MCTAITYQNRNHYFGRNLDLEYSYQETVTITPRNYPFFFRCKPAMHHHYAMIGMATVADSYPLHYEATNEKGLSMAGLNFPGNAVYRPKRAGMDNIAPFEFIPWILGQCASVGEAKVLLDRLNLAEIPFSNAFPLTPLHWILADKEQCLTIEPMSEGLQIQENTIGVLTNNPPFLYQMNNLANYMNLTRDEPVCRFAAGLDLTPYSVGMGAIGLPGDLSSASRFVRATFTKLNSVCGRTESESISQFFHILGSVAQQCGCVKVGDQFEKTLYTSCCNTDKGIYYYTTYENSQITAIQMHRENLDCSELICFPTVRGQQIRWEN